MLPSASVDVGSINQMILLILLLVEMVDFVILESNPIGQTCSRTPSMDFLIEWLVKHEAMATKKKTSPALENPFLTIKPIIGSLAIETHCASIIGVVLIFM